MSKIPEDLIAVVEAAVREDLGSGDITAQLISDTCLAHATIYCKQDAVVCGLAWVNEVFSQITAPSRNRIDIQWAVADGDNIRNGCKLATLSGHARSLLSGERCALNFLQTLSGTATISKHYAELVSHTAVKLLDTRKTIPGLRTAQKYAVSIGGCANHRMGGYDDFLIKENHISACGSLENAISKAKQLYPDKSVEIEIEQLGDLERAITDGANVVMLDNFKLEQVVEAVAINAGRVKLEASGGISEETLVPVAETGVDYISVGDLTKNLRVTDLSMRFE
ncbi:MAG: carboxylating nicotinate-nucleotide diphosphorylase [Proteobacteria bacterium]|nr:carboxylating nicotinate-nucleotide diphosphorylase [Pseudomonadota bacterium]